MRLLVASGSFAKTDEPIEMQFGIWARGAKGPHITWRTRSPPWEKQFFAETGVILGHARRRYVQPYSQRDSSDAELAIFTLATV